MAAYPPCHSFGHLKPDTFEPRMKFFKRNTARKSHPTTLASEPKATPSSRTSLTSRTHTSPVLTMQRSNRQSQGKNTSLDLPPAYSPVANGTSSTIPVNRETAPVAAVATDQNDSPYAFLRQFDTIFLIDDSGSMAGRSWRETGVALSAITPICTAHDSDGIDIFFLNNRNPRANDNLGGYSNVTSARSVENIFSAVRPFGGTPTGTRLNQILKPYLARLTADLERNRYNGTTEVKPLNIIVITDGVASDDVESVIVSAAKRLDSLGAEPWQVGIQFFQVGSEPEAAAELADLDDALSDAHGVRDMVDTVPWVAEDHEGLTAEKLLKITMGSVNRRLDRRRA